MDAIPARIIFRSPHSWNSTVWVATDSHTAAIAKNSPVVVGKSIVGVVDYVGKGQCRIRLITDSGLTPSVRAVREVDGKLWHLAKGELQGRSEPLWRRKSHQLHGSGFQYDFPDGYGPARDLRTGKPQDSSLPPLPLVEVGDLLITTGMDGVFPPNFQVATVDEIHILKEGNYFYNLEATPTAGNLEDLSLVFILPPMGYHPHDLPPTIL